MPQSADIGWRIMFSGWWNVLLYYVYQPSNRICCTREVFYALRRGSSHTAFLVVTFRLLGNAGTQVLSPGVACTGHLFTGHLRTGAADRCCARRRKAHCHGNLSVSVHLYLFFHFYLLYIRALCRAAPWKWCRCESMLVFSHLCGASLISLVVCWFTSCFCQTEKHPVDKIGGDCVKIVDVVTPLHRNLLLFCFALSHRLQKHYRFEYFHGVGAYLRARLELGFGIGGHWREGLLAHAVALPHKLDSCWLWCFTENISCLTACVFHLQVESGLLLR